MIALSHGQPAKPGRAGTQFDCCMQRGKNAHEFPCRTCTAGAKWNWPSPREWRRTTGMAGACRQGGEREEVCRPSVFCSHRACQAGHARRHIKLLGWVCIRLLLVPLKGRRTPECRCCPPPRWRLASPPRLHSEHSRRSRRLVFLAHQKAALHSRRSGHSRTCTGSAAGSTDQALGCRLADSEGRRPASTPQKWLQPYTPAPHLSLGKPQQSASPGRAASGTRQSVNEQGQSLSRGVH